MKKTFLFSALLASVAAAQAAPTTIAGIAKNGSNGNKPLANAVVQLVRPNDKGAKTIIAATRTDATGRFAFPARDYSDSDLLMANVPHQGFDYWAVAYDGGGKLKKVGINVNSAKVDLPVFDTTTQPVPLDFQVHHLAIQSSATGLKVIERIVVENPSRFTLMGVGPRHISVLLDIPQSAKNVRLDPKITDAKLVQTPSGWGVIRPITPQAYGARNALIVNYNMDWPSALPWAKSIDLSHKTVYPTKFFFVARTTEDKALQVTAPKLSADTDAPVPIDGQTQTRLINSIGSPMMPPGGAPAALPAGQDIEVAVSKPVSPTFWGFAAMTVALCLFLPLAMIKPRAGKGTKTLNGNFAEPSYGALVSEHSASGPIFPVLEGFGTDLALSAPSRELIRKIADLDDQYEAKHIGETEYQERRAAWKKQLIESLGAPPLH